MDLDTLTRRFVDAYNSRQLEAQIDSSWCRYARSWRAPSTEDTTASGRFAESGLVAQAGAVHEWSELPRLI
jgi:hypothetical protein